MAWSQVTVASPVQGSIVSSPIHVTASATSTHPITAMRIYLDSQSVFLTSSAQINTSVAASSGTHLLVVQAWDSTGAVFKTPRTVTVGGSAPPPPPPPTNGNVFNEVQQWTGWQTCGACGNTGGGGALANYSMIRGITYPTLSGSSTEFSIGGGHPYANAYWFYRHQPLSQGLQYLRYEFDLYVPAGSENAPEAIEFQCQQKLNNEVYNFAWQANYVSNRWRVFNYTTTQWEDSGIPFQRFSPGTWHHIVAEYHNNPTTHTTYHDALTVDGVRHALAITHRATPLGVSNDFTNAFQLDLNGSATAFKVFVDNMKITFTEY